MNNEVIYFDFTRKNILQRVENPQWKTVGTEDAGFESVALYVWANDLSNLADECEARVTAARNSASLNHNAVMRKELAHIAFYFDCTKQSIRESVERIHAESRRIADENVRQSMRDEVEV